MKTVLCFYLISLGSALVLARPARFNFATGFNGLLEDLTLCKTTFQLMYSDGNEYLNRNEFRNALNALGLRVNDATFETILIRYGDKEGHVTFDDFVSCYLELKNLFENIEESETDGDGPATEVTGQRRQFNFGNIGGNGNFKGDFSANKNDNSRENHVNNNGLGTGNGNKYS